MFFLLAGVLVGCVGWIALGAVGFFLLRIGWDAYAAAEPHKAYTLGMLLSRGWPSAWSARWQRVPWQRSSPKATGELLGGWADSCCSFRCPSHFVSVWADYPAWYHFAYLLPLMPITGFSGYLILNIENKTKHDQQGRYSRC